MRLLACGGDSRGERARIGNWPEIPRALLLDVRGLERGTPSFGLGQLQGRQFLVYRELCGTDEDRIAYSLLFEPSRRDFERFHWNAAWLLASLLADAGTRGLLVERPEQASDVTLEAALDRLAPIALEPREVPMGLAGMLSRAALETQRFVAPLSVAGDAPLTPITIAAMLEDLPVALRTGRGWMFGGHDSNAEVLGCALWMGDAPLSSPEIAPGVAALERLERMAVTNTTVAELLDTPWCDWQARGQGLIHGLRTIELLEKKPAHAWEVLDSVPAREGPLAAEIRAAAVTAIDGWTGPLESDPTRMLLEEIEAGRHGCDAALVARFDRGAVLRYFSERDVPPAPWPIWIEHAPALKAELWTRCIAEAGREGPTLAALAMADLAPAGRSDAAREVVTAAIEAARADAGDPLDWEAFAGWPDYPEWRAQIGTWVRHNVLKMRGDWPLAYVALGDDPGGRVLASSNIAAPVAARVVLAMIEALGGPRAAKARAWLEQLATSPLRDALPLKIKLDIASAVKGPWAPLERLNDLSEGRAGETIVAPEEERPFLARELEQIVGRTPGASVDLAPLHAMFGGQLPERAQRAVAKWVKGGPAESSRSTPNWIANFAQRFTAPKPAPSPPAPEAPRVEKPVSRPPVVAPPKPKPKPMPMPAAPPPAPKPVVAKEPPRPAPPPKPVKAAEPPRTAPPAQPQKTDEPARRGPPMLPWLRKEPSQPAPPAPKPLPVAAQQIRPAARPVKPTVPAPPAPMHDAPRVVIRSDPAKFEVPTPAPVAEAAIDVKEPLRAWIVGGNAADDQRADEEMIAFFEKAGPRERAGARAALESFGPGLLYRLASRTASNPRLLDGIARALDDRGIDRIVADAAHYDVPGFGLQIIERVRRRAIEGPAPADDAALRLLRVGPPDLLTDLVREMRRMDAALTEEATRLASGRESAGGAAA